MTAIIGAGLDRVDAPLKVTGSAHYPNDFAYPGMAHAALVRATVAAGRIRAIDTSAAEAAPGVLTVITHRTAPQLERGPMTLLGPSPPAPLQDDRVLHHGQHVAIVVADSAEQARHAATLVRVEYETAKALLDLDDPRAEIVTDPWGLDTERGDVAAGFARSPCGRATRSPCTTPPSGRTPCARRWRGSSRSPRAGSGCSRRTWAAGSAPGCACGRTSS
ncbi:hypothetical protein ACBJ59_30425 [Nonomuraea sp. MTCD27]|uniref:hypothetical protein n=1 Tax=Nonomuraea sp. MTCD27 TaxID=1676747 RepID=UPI0035BF54D1